MRRVPWNAGYGEKNKPAGNDALKRRLGRSDEETRHHVRWEKPLARAHDQAGRSALPLGGDLERICQEADAVVGCVEIRTKPDCAAVCAPDTAWAGLVCLVGSLCLQVSHSAITIERGAVLSKAWHSTARACARPFLPYMSNHGRRYQANCVGTSYPHRHLVSHHGCKRNRGERERDGDGESSPGIRDQKARMLKQPYPTTCSGYFLRRGMMA